MPLKQNQSPTYASEGTPIFLLIMSIPSQVIPNSVEFLVANYELASFLQTFE
jgi:hypothetical protein